MDTTDEEIVFDQRGYCNHCNNYFEQAPKILNHGPKGQKKLEELVNTIKKKGETHKMAQANKAFSHNRY